MKRLLPILLVIGLVGCGGGLSYDQNEALLLTKIRTGIETHDCKDPKRSTKEIWYDVLMFEGYLEISNGTNETYQQAKALKEIVRTFNSTGSETYCDLKKNNIMSAVKKIAESLKIKEKK